MSVVTHAPQAVGDLLLVYLNWSSVFSCVFIQLANVLIAQTVSLSLVVLYFFHDDVIFWSVLWQYLFKFMVKILNNLLAIYNVILDGLESWLDKDFTINPICEKLSNRFACINKMVQKMKKKHLQLTQSNWKEVATSFLSTSIRVPTIQIIVKAKTPQRGQ